MATRINNVNLHQLDILNRRHKPTRRIAEREKKYIQRTLFVGFFFCWPFDKVIQWQALVSYFLFSLFPSMGWSVSGLFSILTFFLVISITWYNFKQYFTLIYYYDSKSRPFSAKASYKNCARNFTMAWFVEIYTNFWK